MKGELIITISLEKYSIELRGHYVIHLPKEIPETRIEYESETIINDNIKKGTLIGKLVSVKVKTKEFKNRIRME